MSTLYFYHANTTVPETSASCRIVPEASKDETKRHWITITMLCFLLYPVHSTTTRRIVKVVGVKSKSDRHASVITTKIQQILAPLKRHCDVNDSTNGTMLNQLHIYCFKTNYDVNVASYLLYTHTSTCTRHKLWERTILTDCILKLKHCTVEYRLPRDYIIALPSSSSKGDSSSSSTRNHLGRDTSSIFTMF